VLPDHEPVLAVSVCPSRAVPVIDGAAVFAGAEVITMVPLAPTAQQSPVTHDTPPSELLVPDVCATQLAPPLPVATIVPPAPTAQHELDVGHDTTFS
jgi:hypothetical protein